MAITITAQRGTYHSPEFEPGSEADVSCETQGGPTDQWREKRKSLANILDIHDVR